MPIFRTASHLLHPTEIKGVDEKADACIFAAVYGPQHRSLEERAVHVDDLPRKRGHEVVHLGSRAACTRVRWSVADVERISSFTASSGY